MKERQFTSSDVKYAPRDWPWRSHGSLILGKFNLKINRSMKTPRQECSAVACPYSSPPVGTEYRIFFNETSPPLKSVDSLGFARRP